MKADLATTIITAAVGVVVSFLVINLMLPEIEDVSFPSPTSESYSITSPSDDTFNFNSLNPTVEVYVGQCETYNSDGSCREGSSTVNSGTDETNDENYAENSDYENSNEAE